MKRKVWMIYKNDILNAFRVDFKRIVSNYSEWVKFAQLCLTLCNPMNCNPPGTSVHGILQARILEWVAISFSKWSSQPRDRIQVSRIAGGFFTNWATRDTQPPGQAIKLELSHTHKKRKMHFSFLYTQSASIVHFPHYNFKFWAGFKLELKQERYSRNSCGRWSGTTHPEQKQSQPGS